MIAAKSLHSTSQRMDSTHRLNEASSASSLSRLALVRVTQDKKMEYTQQNDQVTVYQSNFRAEDGAPTGRSNALYEGVVIPLASLFAVVLFVVGAMMLNH
jgi:hypothetical protein